MALEFSPPTDLVNAYYQNKKDEAQRTTDAFNNLLATYAQLKEGKQKEALAQQTKDIEMAKGLAGSGQDFLDAYKQVVAARTPTPKVPFSTPRAPTALGGYLNPDTVNPQANQPSPLIQASIAAGHPAQPDILAVHGPQSNTAGVNGLTQAPVPPPVQSTGTVKGITPPTSASPMTTNPATDPMVQEYQKDPMAFKKQHGSAGIAKLGTQVTLDKALTEKPAEKYYTNDQATKLLKNNKDAIATIGSFPKDQIPRDAVHLMMTSANHLDLGTKQDQFDQKEWDKIVKDTNPLTASSRSTLGMASKANFQADRALVTLSKPVVTNQEAGNVMADIAAIYQTGSPTQYGMSHQEYSTLYGKVQGALQTITGKPQDALPDAIKERLVGVLHDMKGTNGQVLKQQLDFTEKAKSRIIKKFPQEWQDIRSTLESNPNSPGQTAIPKSGPHGASVSQNGNIYNWNPRTGQYE